MNFKLVTYWNISDEQWDRPALNKSLGFGQLTLTVTILLTILAMKRQQGCESVSFWLTDKKLITPL